MGWQIVKQPNEKYAIWSTIVENFIFISGTEQEIVDFYVEDAVETATIFAKRALKNLDEKSLPFTPSIDSCLFSSWQHRQGATSWEECLADIKARHGEAELKELLEATREGKSK